MREGSTCVAWLGSIALTPSRSSLPLCNTRTYARQQSTGTEVPVTVPHQPNGGAAEVTVMPGAVSVAGAVTPGTVD